MVLYLMVCYYGFISLHNALRSPVHEITFLRWSRSYCSAANIFHGIGRQFLLCGRVKLTSPSLDLIARATEGLIGIQFNYIATKIYILIFTVVYIFLFLSSFALKTWQLTHVKYCLSFCTFVTANLKNWSLFSGHFFHFFQRTGHFFHTHFLGRIYYDIGLSARQQTFC